MLNAQQNLCTDFKESLLPTVLFGHATVLDCLKITFGWKLQIYSAVVELIEQFS